MKLDVVFQQSHSTDVQAKMLEVITNANLPLILNWHLVDKINNKTLKQLVYVNPNTSNSVLNNPFLIAEFDKKDAITCYLCTIQCDDKGKPSITKVSPDWYKLQRRIVTAGRKSELLLQACKLTADSKVIDATAGFGYDSLILASSGAGVTMFDQNPVMALLLMLERERMNREPNWQGLMGRLDIRFGDAVECLLSSDDFSDNSLPNPPPARGREQVDVIYLDPMFPQDSYQGAKVGKGMQVLHGLAKPPTLKQEQTMLDVARSSVTKNGRVVVKRPKNAPYIANQQADESWANDVVRFDAYFV